MDFKLQTETLQQCGIFMDMYSTFEVLSTVQGLAVLQAKYFKPN